MQAGELLQTLFQFTPLHERQRRFRELRGHHAYFNSRLYMRGSGPALESYGTRYIFQFTPLHERQPPLLFSLLSDQHFNSRLYMRGSSKPVCSTQRHSIFQFTPLHERQLPGLSALSLPLISIHAST